MRDKSAARDNVLLLGCAAGLGLLADRLNSRTGPGRFVWLARSSTEALQALAKEQTHIAGVHLVDGKTGVANVTDVRRIVGSGTVLLVTLARWEVGLVVPSGNPRRIRSAVDLARPGLRLVVREAGSGARRLLERELRAAQLPVSLAKNAPLRANGHLEVAQCVALGAADTGIATRDAALSCHLDFVPLAEERYDLALARDHLDDVRWKRLLDVMTSSGLRQELSSLGYDVRSCGDRVADIDAA